jgi:hypothetical protein
MTDINEHTKVPFGRRENKNKPLGKVTDKFIGLLAVALAVKQS